MMRAACLVPLVLAAGLLQADEQVVFRSDVSLVRVDAQVVDRDNRAITGLTARDFVLKEEGRPQEIRNFASEEMPVDVLLLLDVSASMRPHVQLIASAAHQALRVLGENDRVAIMVFDRSTRVRLPFRSNRDEVEREFESLLRQESFNGGTDITRGLVDAANYMAREARRDARRAIVILTDDQTERDRDEAKVSRALTNADAVLSALIAPDAMRTGHGGMGRGGSGGGGTWPGGGPTIGGPLGGIILGRRGPYGGRGPGGGGPGMGGPRTQSAGTSEIAKASGGDSMPADDASALESTLARIRQRYALHFHLPQGVKPGQERDVEVELADAARGRYPGAEVRYRRVYITPTAVADGSKANAEPTVVSRVPVTAGTGSGQPAAGSGAPDLKRRPAVNGPVVEGPSIGASDAGSSQSQGGWRRTDDPAAQPAPAPGDTGSTGQDSQQGGWRRVKPGEQ